MKHIVDKSLVDEFVSQLKTDSLNTQETETSFPPTGDKSGTPGPESGFPPSGDKSGVTGE